MAGLPIVRFPHPLLTRPTRSIERVDREVKRLIDAMVATMRHHPRCVGLAAPQVGSGLRVAVMDASHHPKVPKAHGLLVLINPEIKASEGRVIQREGCLSVPDFTANVSRVTRISLSAMDEFGSIRSLWLEGFEAIIAQHEIDHLDGKLFLDRVANVKTDIFRRKNYL